MDLNKGNEVCTKMFDKSSNNIDCVDIDAKLIAQNETHLIMEEVFNSTYLINGTEISSISHNKTVFTDLNWIGTTVCDAEKSSQKLKTEINGYMAPIGNEHLNLNA